MHHGRILFGIILVLILQVSVYSIPTQDKNNPPYNLKIKDNNINPGIQSLFMAASGSRSDIQNAVDQASPGDIVRIPAGNYDFNGTVFVNIGIHIQGAGRGQTILRKVGPERYMFRFHIYNNAPSAFSGIKLLDPEGPFTQYNISKASIGVEFAYGCWDFKVYNCEFEGFGNAGVITKEYWGSSGAVTSWQSRGVIYNKRIGLLL